MTFNQLNASGTAFPANYYCTWKAQGAWRTQNSHSAQEMRDRIDADFLFGADGVLPALPEEVRSELIVVLDDGWDVARGTLHESNSDCGRFGSLIPDGGKFPALAALEPQERLRALSEQVKALGYAGLGLWVPANYYQEDPSASREARLRGAADFWTERGKWCAYADIRYLKVDWGWHGRDIEYRELMTETVKKYSPGTLMEHVVGVFDMPYDPAPEVQNAPAFRDFQELARRTAAVSDVYRTYDVVDTLATATTLMRVAAFFDGTLTAKDGLLGLVNVEDEVLIGAALGMTVGVMRYAGQPRFNEVIKALRWQKLAPPFRAESGQLVCSKELLCDRFFFDTAPEVWPYVGQKTIAQYAPARMARCAPLAEVSALSEEQTPFVLTSRNPLTGAYTVAALPRTAPGRYKYRADAEITVREVHTASPLGVFGSFGLLRAFFDKSLAGKRVLARDLLTDAVQDITPQVRCEDCTLLLDGAAAKTFTPAQNGDESEAAFVLTVTD